MGFDPETGVVDADHRVWDTPNLFLADGSVMPTQGAANPALTIMALSSRLAERLHQKRAHTGQRADSGRRFRVPFRKEAGRAKV